MDITAIFRRILLAYDIAPEEVMNTVNRILKDEGDDMGKQKQDLSDLFGDADTPTTSRKGKTMGTKEQKAKQQEAIAKSVAKHKATAPKAAAPAPKAKAAAPAPKAAAPAPKAKAKASSNGTRGARGSGKFYFDPDEKAKVMVKVKQKVTKPISTKDLAEALGIETWKVRLAAVALAAEKQIKMEKIGTTMQLKPR